MKTDSVGFLLHVKICFFEGEEKCTVYWGKQ